MTVPKDYGICIHNASSSIRHVRGFVLGLCQNCRFNSNVRLKRNSCCCCWGGGVMISTGLIIVCCLCWLLRCLLPSSIDAVVRGLKAQPHFRHSSLSYINIRRRPLFGRTVLSQPRDDETTRRRGGHCLPSIVIRMTPSYTRIVATAATDG